MKRIHLVVEGDDGPVYPGAIAQCRAFKFDIRGEVPDDISEYEAVCMLESGLRGGNAARAVQCRIEPNDG